MGNWICLSQQTVAHVNYIVDQSPAHRRLRVVWARVYQLNETRIVTRPRHAPSPYDPPITTAERVQDAFDDMKGNICQALPRATS
jgi:hypothetical protein